MIIRRLLAAIGGCAMLAGPLAAAPISASDAAGTASPVLLPADWATRQSALCQTAIAAAEARYKLPPGLLGTIARVESARPITSLHDIRAWPWTIDADGQGLFLDSKAAAVAWVGLARQRGVRSIDVGCLQVNLQMHLGAFASLADAFDPDQNADYAARYLVSLRQEAGGNWNVAVGLYHSHTPALAAEYRDRVAAVGRGIVTGIGGPEPLYQRAIRQGTLRLTLAGGSSLMLHVRQPSMRPHRLGSCRLAEMMDPLLHTRMRTTHCPPAPMPLPDPAGVPAGG